MVRADIKPTLVPRRVRKGVQLVHQTPLTAGVRTLLLCISRQGFVLRMILVKRIHVAALIVPDMQVLNALRTLHRSSARRPNSLLLRLFYRLFATDKVVSKLLERGVERLRPSVVVHLITEQGFQS